ncbi:hypothetical protein BT63DRAFT_439226 [Microthyrium microscopicum]|uniref:Uncharacterized protein n=1 Tax=Microthyrium microscopicum TaxID=703497 RepID=A0A6A6UEQ2_9PEZI|nr:hypothetical protein BT63DRAFT_439226 [Microthyrium microscopicum]
MPLFINPAARQQDAYIPLKANIDDMVNCTTELEEDLKYVVEDGETFGLLSTDTYLENAPQIIKNLERISSLLLNSVQDLTFDDEAFDLADSNLLALVLYSFLNEHRRAIAVLATQHKTLKTTGPLFDSVGRCLDTERRALDRFRAAIEARYHEIKERTAGDWENFNSAMSEATSVYPAPTMIMVDV